MKTRLINAGKPHVPLGFTLWSILWGIASFILTFPWQPDRWAVHQVLHDGTATTSVTIHHLVAWKLLRYTVCALATAAPFVARRHPWPACLMALSCLAPYVVAGQGLNVSLGSFCALLGVAMASMHCNRRLGLGLGALALAIPASFTFFSSVTFWTLGVYGQVDSSSWEPTQRLESFAIYALGTMFALGLAATMSLSYARSRERRAVEVRTAEVDTRAALARDLHDVVAHRMSLVAVRAETAPYSLDGLSGEARQAFADIATEARGALDEMRGVLGVLDHGNSLDDAASQEPQLAPQPQAADIPALVATAQEAGSPVELVGTVPEFDALTGVTAYRVVQEALTNARRHAPNATARVSFEASRDGEAPNAPVPNVSETSDATMTQSLHGSVQPHASSTEDNAADAVTIRVTNQLVDDGTAYGSLDVPVEFGRGLAGMKERVERSGGMFHVKRQIDEAGRPQFVVEATLPLHAGKAAQ